MNELRVGIAGFGYTGRLHLAACRQIPGVHVVAVADANLDARRAAPPDVQCLADHRELLSLDLDIVNVCLPTALHAPVTIDALAAGKHVLVEKPIATNMADANAMIAAARHAGRRLFTGMTHRFYPEVREAKKCVDDGGIGEIVLIRDCIFEPVGFLGGPSWYRDKESAGGGTVLSSGIHLVDRVMWFANGTPASVSGFTSDALFGHGVENTAQMSLGFGVKCSAQLSFGWLAEPHPLICDLELIGTRGSIVVHTWQGYEHRTAAGAVQRRIYESEPHADKVVVGLRAEIEEFCNAVREAREPWPSVEESTRALRVVEAFYEAASAGTVINLE